MFSRAIVVVVAAMALAASGPAARADALKVLSAGSVQDVIEDVGRRFERDSGQPVSFDFTTAGQVRSKVLAGAPVDVVIASTAVAGELEKAGKLVAGLSTVLGWVGLGVAVREGVPIPDVRTPEAFKKTLLAAKKVAFTDPKAGGTAGLYFADLLKSLGVADAVNKKAVLTAGGRDTAERVARGDADLGVTFVSEIAPVSGAKLAGLLPPEMRNYTTYVAGVASVTTKAETAHAFIAAATSSAMTQRWREAGFETPVGR